MSMNYIWFIFDHFGLKLFHGFSESAELGEKPPLEFLENTDNLNSLSFIFPLVFVFLHSTGPTEHTHLIFGFDKRQSLAIDPRILIWY
jgi:hypothetical protein